MATVKITRTKIVNGALFSKGGEYEVDKPTHNALKRAGALGKVAAPAPAAEEEAEQETAGATHDNDTN